MTEGSAKPKRIQRKRTKGWKMPPNTVYVGRPTKWGNPYVAEEDVTCAECVGQYREHWWKKGGKWYFDANSLDRIDVRELRGKDLSLLVSTRSTLSRRRTSGDRQWITR